MNWRDEMVQYQLRIDRDQHAAIVERCRERSWTLATWLREAIREKLERDDA